MEAYEKFYKLNEWLGNQPFMEAILNYFTTDQINEFCDDIANEYDIDFEY